MHSVTIVISSGSPYGTGRYLWTLRPSDREMGAGVRSVFEAFARRCPYRARAAAER